MNCGLTFSSYSYSYNYSSFFFFLFLLPFPPFNSSFQQQRQVCLPFQCASVQPSHHPLSMENPFLQKKQPFQNHRKNMKPKTTNFTDFAVKIMNAHQRVQSVHQHSINTVEEDLIVTAKPSEIANTQVLFRFFTYSSQAMPAHFEKSSSKKP